jgi:hypothetical protein
MTVSICPISGGIRLQGPRPLSLRGMNLRPEAGVYVVSSGDAISYVGSSGRLSDRVRTLAHLGSHRGSARVLCAAHCTGEAPQVWWAYTKSVARARGIEADLKLERETRFFGSYLQCEDGDALRSALVEASGRDSWTAGYVEAVFSIGEHLAFLNRRELADAWKTVGIPPGPWAERLRATLA